jgi:hypothetical protein
MFTIDLNKMIKTFKDMIIIKSMGSGGAFGKVV